MQLALLKMKEREMDSVIIDNSLGLAKKLLILSHPIILRIVVGCTTSLDRVAIYLFL